LIMVTVLRGDLLPSTGNSQLSKNEATVPGISPVNNDRFD
jgi:hypothetical protein